MTLQKPRRLFTGQTCEEREGLGMDAEPADGSGTCFLKLASKQKQIEPALLSCI